MRPFLPFLATLCLGAGLCAAPLASAERAATVNYVRGLANPDGGFRAGAPAGASSLATTNAALRALKYLGGKSNEDAQRYLDACADPSGGFRDGPSGAVDVRSTAMGLMVAAECKSRRRDDADHGVRRYFASHVTTLADIYIAAAALDAAHLKIDKAAEWADAYQATRNPDGTYGKNPAEHAGAVITFLRLGIKFDPAAARKHLPATQLADGGFAAAGEKGDLAATYRVTRALAMLKARPNVERLAGFVASCRNADGGYGLQPGQPSSISATYYAAIVLHWSAELGKTARRGAPDNAGANLGFPRLPSPRPFLR